ncbi:MAG: hypothetical protein A3H69_01195 [Candidatus Sungbacteria bacterium RIFCSPLOWO2_02_FULL_47_9]|uniref:UDP-N-acetylmuramoyl-tripeptide--D-alanyl-D-alanine ligase n=1 Tax=Candidatus Sungbacteria bacterium RIFCSPHIGHO2_01_FULL_47_32 TaxID=1802264 RepID=A0A1G2K5U9_9BACT|nr:MAG: UDP-N-acetylmuramoyl-tripeptide-D-alanyl-D-alanine ligase [Parcubacteria group bacterium GW2011_GWA2_47_10]OGZ93808.1 MAG: hypothetical protein A2633_05020 [Candidatus Sungbacteria bacterium RIFCSPHIGHO2_01_FULL_47_32]OGZ99662.1 MAG: hypothetical protein A3D57_04235 [Candidatus Sungbacteria bacterium RIFCSPHIGHO2_02_FULL_46_12]OHA05706.1 MAG: hypothetical protein A3A28_01550 [Candidatus Sungbacteria bacterium RIFCSPLOWO2_01_FULL_47_32]OHA12140.1 MAG: hypothetical protein A3H69_01195 [Ca
MPEQILQYILNVLARLTLKRYRPLIIGITGSVGKTSTKEAIFSVLKKKYNVRRNEKSFNTEIGLPLTILGAKNHHRNIIGWVVEILVSFLKIIFVRRYPEVLILEYGVQKPKDMDYLVRLAPPSIAVVTAIGDIPVHVEFFAGPEEVGREKAKLVDSLRFTGNAVLNIDDTTVLDMKERTRAKTLTFGFDERADFRISNYELRLKHEEKQNTVPEGIVFKITYRGKVIPIRLNNCFGKPQVYSATAAAVVGVILSMNLVEVAEALLLYEPPPGRLRLLPGNKGSYIIDDTYNASPQAMREALELLKSLPGSRRIAVLGDMLEIGKFTEHAHRAVGEQLAAFADILLTVGPRSKFIAEEATLRGINKKERLLDPRDVFSFDDSLSAGKKLDELIKPGDLILIKGSQSMRMEHVVEEVMAHPEDAGRMLVRQDKYWTKK